VTHELGLRNAAQPWADFLSETAALEEKRGPLLMQLPPSFAFNARVVARFLDMLRGRYDGAVVCEPRHPSWFVARADALLCRYRVARVAADPAVTAEAAIPGGWPDLAYFRLHGSPHMYWSRYETNVIEGLARRLQELSVAAEVWCIFDNTATGAAIENARELQLLFDRSAG
jgi:uncharacterized protein YecE (DUF72 family)